MDFFDAEENKKRKLDRYDIPIMFNIYEEDFKYEDMEKEDKNKEFHYKRYTIEKKLEIIEKAGNLGNRKTVKLYNIDESSIHYIRKNKDEYEKSQH